jgi:IS4 transposase
LGVLNKLSREERRNATYRYIVYRDPLTKKVFYFVTSDKKASGQSIADIYKKRWAVELLFRWLKGHLDVRYLAPKNKNAIKIQLAMAVLLQLLLQLKKIVTRYQGTLWTLLRGLRTSLIRESLANSDPPEGCRWKSANLQPLRAKAS